MSRSRLAVVAAVAGVALAPAARAAEDPSVSVGAAGEPRQELGFVPVLGGDSDVGLTFGVAGALTRFEPGLSTYRWRVDAAAITSVKPAQNLVTHQDYHVGLAVLGLWGDRLRLDTRLGFSRFANGEYHGIGNFADEPSTSQEFGLLYPEGQLAARVTVWKGLALFAGVTYRHVWPQVSSTGTLAAALRNPTPIERELLVGTDSHAVADLNSGVVWDTRDNDVSPTRGSFLQFQLQFAPAFGGSFKYPFGGFDLELEHYQQIRGPGLLLATRLVLDVVAGRPPFYELARLRDATPAPGGGQAVRGVPEYRYFGKDKGVANLELRYTTRPFTVLRQSVRLGTVTFVDLGRIENEASADGHGLGLKVGLGGGVRLYWGEGFVLRGDLAWSPDARPVAFYFNVNQAF